MATDNRVTPTGLIKVTTNSGETYIDPAYIAMISRGTSEGAAISIAGIGTNPVLVSETPAAVLALLKEGRAVQAVMRRGSSDGG
jgi:hypothetical protein